MVAQRAPPNRLGRAATPAPRPSGLKLDAEASQDGRDGVLSEARAVSPEAVWAGELASVLLGGESSPAAALPGPPARPQVRPIIWA